VVGPRALESRQERVVDVDDATQEIRAERLRQDLHVAGQDDDVHRKIVDDSLQLRLGFFLGTGRDVREGDSVLFGHGGAGRVIRDDHRDPRDDTP